MINITNLLAISSTFFIITASPGPATLALASTTMSSGRNAGLRFCAGLTFGLAIWGVIAATGLGSALQTSNQTLSFIKLFGGFYLLWLAWCSAKSALSNKTDLASSINSNKSFGLGVILNLSNPQAVFVWMATLSLGASDNTSTLQVIVATVICIILSFLIYAFYALVFSIPKVMNWYNNAKKWIDTIVTILFTIAGMVLLKSAF